MSSLETFAMQHGYTKQEEFWLKRALTRQTSANGLLAQAVAIEQLSEAGVDVPVDPIRSALEDIAFTQSLVFSARQAAMKATRLLAILDGKYDMQYPSETPNELAPNGYWPYDGSEPDLDQFEELDRGWEFDLQKMRDEWRTRICGKPNPGWKRGQVASPDGEDEGEFDDAA